MIIDKAEIAKIHNARSLFIKTVNVDVIIDKDSKCIIIGNNNCYNMLDDCREQWYSRSISDNEHHIKLTFGQVLYAIYGDLLESWMIDCWQKNIITIEYG